ncbi:Cell fate regulator YlbF, YheA/YmcA/DUF963 family (controls sporulation, competence, biofilm development) [Clostridium acidisoli DSM 12555]|uniref:UPF0342 protein SAMN02745134_01319 n=1 Tax=Clostridium acidisoli DSM 12555 TaxID=1121291 RepID=A0A1W1XCE2_9CLOT|nr:YlbF family regulator [Clostridium acidisoli]SMC21502.1 Cell fate regulator YlbF, YheA/YmcA/DUF963 family (controls sporulation, competence, biofilm development) [Clostridium acidisoli DSM 12555]
MDNVYDKAHELAKVLKSYPEVSEYREASEKIKNNADAQKIIEDFRKIQFEAYNEQMEKKQLSEDTKKKFENISNIISMNQDVAQFLTAEQKFSIIWQDIIKILTDSIGLDLNFGMK